MFDWAFVKNQNRWDLIHLLIIFGWTVLSIRYFWAQTGDDSYIFYRYATQLIQGYGLQWNPSGDAVEGYSSPLWVLWLGLLGRVSDIPTVAQWTGAVCVITASVLMWTRTRCAWTVWGLSLTMGFHYWGTSGLETSLYVYLFLSVLPLMSTQMIHQNRQWSWMALGLLSLTRPEAPALVLLILGWRFWQDRDGRIFLVTVPMLLWLAFRLYTYDDWLPNTYWAKATGDRMHQVLAGLNYAGWLGIPLLLGIWRSAERMMWMLPLTLWLIVVLGGGDWMWHHRLLVPIIAGIWMLSTQVEGYGRWLIQGLLCLYWMPLSTILGVFTGPLDGTYLPIEQRQEGNLIEVSALVAEEIHAALPPDIRIAINHAGALPYFLPEASFVDMSALNDRYLAKMEGNLHEKYDAEYILDQHPDLIVLNSFVDPSLVGVTFEANYWQGETLLFRHPRFSKEYVPVAKSWRRIRHGGGIASIWLFQRRQQILP